MSPSAEAIPTSATASLLIHSDKFEQKCFEQIFYATLRRYKRSDFDLEPNPSEQSLSVTLASTNGIRETNAESKSSTVAPPNPLLYGRIEPDSCPPPGSFQSCAFFRIPDRFVSPRLPPMASRRTAHISSSSQRMPSDPSCCQAQLRGSEHIGLEALPDSTYEPATEDGVPNSVAPATPHIHSAKDDDSSSPCVNVTSVFGKELVPSTLNHVSGNMHTTTTNDSSTKSNFHNTTTTTSSHSHNITRIYENCTFLHPSPVSPVPDGVPAQAPCRSAQNSKLHCGPQKGDQDGPKRKSRWRRWSITRFPQRRTFTEVVYYWACSYAPALIAHPMGWASQWVPYWSLVATHPRPVLPYGTFS